MWIDKRLPLMRRHPAYGMMTAVGLIAAVVVLKWIFPQFPPFLPLYPVVVLSAFIGGRPAGIFSWIVCSGLAAYYFPAWEIYPGLAGFLVIAGFAAVCGLIIFVVDLLDRAVLRFQHERRKLDLALGAADLATWELTPGEKVVWDRHFFAMTGIAEKDGAPPLERFLAMVHPDDQHRLREARTLMDQGQVPAAKDEYRVTRPDGRTVWLANYRTMIDADSKRYFIGITQNITSRKRDEKQIRHLMRELVHRVKNQYGIVLAIVRETGRQMQVSPEFLDLVESRILALSRSQDLLLGTQTESVDLHALLKVHLDAFGMAQRVDTQGSTVALNAKAAQYLGIALHELCTNAAKYGAFSHPDGHVTVSCSTEPQDPDGLFKFAWSERNGPAPPNSTRRGFGSRVLKEITPAALSGSATLELLAAGLSWTLSAPARFVMAGMEPTPQD